MIISLLPDVDKQHSKTSPIPQVLIPKYGLEGTLFLTGKKDNNSSSSWVFDEEEPSTTNSGIKLSLFQVKGLIKLSLFQVKGLIKLLLFHVKGLIKLALFQVKGLVKLLLFQAKGLGGGFWPIGSVTAL